MAKWSLAPDELNQQKLDKVPSVTIKTNLWQCYEPCLIQYILLVVPESLPLPADEELVQVVTLTFHHYSLECEACLSVLLAAGSAVCCCHLPAEQTPYQLLLLYYAQHQTGSIKTLTKSTIIISVIIITSNQLQNKLVNFTRFTLLLSVDLGRVSPKLSQLGRQLTERQLDYKLKSSFRFTNVRHVKSNLNQLTDE